MKTSMAASTCRPGPLSRTLRVRFQVRLRPVESLESRPSTEWHKRRKQKTFRHQFVPAINARWIDAFSPAIHLGPAIQRGHFFYYFGHGWCVCVCVCVCVYAASYSFVSLMAVVSFCLWGCGAQKAPPQAPHLRRTRSLASHWCRAGSRAPHTTTTTMMMPTTTTTANKKTRHKTEPDDKTTTNTRQLRVRVSLSPATPYRPLTRVIRMNEKLGNSR